MDGTFVSVRIVPAGLPAIDVVAKSETFVSVTRTTPQQWSVTVNSGHQVAARARDRGFMIAISAQDTAPEVGQLRALLVADQAFADATGSHIPCSVTVRDPVGKKVQYTMPVGVLAELPDEDFTFAPGDLTFGFMGAATVVPLP